MFLDTKSGCGCQGLGEGNQCFMGTEVQCGRGESAGAGWRRQRHSNADVISDADLHTHTWLTRWISRDVYFPTIER